MPSPALNDTGMRRGRCKGPRSVADAPCEAAAKHHRLGNRTRQKAQERRSRRCGLHRRRRRNRWGREGWRAVGVRSRWRSPNPTQTVQITTDVNADTATKRGGRSGSPTIGGALKDKVIPLELEPFIGMNTPLGLALNAPRGGFKRTFWETGFRRLARVRQGKRNPGCVWSAVYSQPAPASSAAPSGGGFFGRLRSTRSPTRPRLVGCTGVHLDAEDRAVPVVVAHSGRDSEEVGNLSRR